MQGIVDMQNLLKRDVKKSKGESIEKMHIMTPEEVLGTDKTEHIGEECHKHKMAASYNDPNRKYFLRIWNYLAPNSYMNLVPFRVYNLAPYRIIQNLLEDFGGVSSDHLNWKGLEHKIIGDMVPDSS